MIKRSPSDFKVEEVIASELLQAIRPSCSAETPFPLYRLHKESLATPEAAGRIARHLGVRSGAIVYAGLKDKHAQTTQHITLNLEQTPAPGSASVPPAPDASSSYPENAVGNGWSIERLGFLPRALAAADIHRNVFLLILKNLSAQECADMDEAARLLGWQPESAAQGHNAPRIVNYFGDQRFGSARHGRGFIARHLVKGDFEGALRLAIATESRKDHMEDKVFKRTLLEHWGRWREVLPKLRPCSERKAVERLANSSGDFRAAFCALPYLLQQLSVYAYQSHLWNEIARRVVETVCAPRGKVLAVDAPFGELLFPAADAIPPELAELNLPLLARKTELQPPWKEAAEEILRAEGVALAELQIPGVRRPFFGEEPRALFFAAENFNLSPPEPDTSAGDTKRHKRRISFALPRGCYATVLLRALGQ